MSPEDHLDSFFQQLCRSQSLQAITECLSWLGAFVITQNGIIVAANSAFCDLLEQDLDSLLGTPAVDVAVVDEKATLQTRFSNNDSRPYTLKLAMRDGSVKLARVAPHVLSLQDKTSRLAAFSDVSEYAELKEVNDRHRQIFAAAGIGIARVKIDGTWLECNQRLCDLLGYSEAELLKMRFQDITHPDDLNSDLGHLNEMLEGTRTTFSMEKRYLHKQGHYIWARITVTLVKNTTGAPLYFVSLLQDITAEKEAEAATKQLNQALENLSFTDGLTGIGNRRKFDVALHNEWRRACREKTCISLIIADIDHFKQFNDSLGHLAGDDCLKQIAATLERHANRVSDCVARYGGEEFAILLPGVTLKNAITMAEECRKAVEALGINQGDDAPTSITTISLGVAEVDPSNERAVEVLIDAADHKLYEAKRAGRNRVMPRIAHSS